MRALMCGCSLKCQVRRRLRVSEQHDQLVDSVQESDVDSCLASRAGERTPQSEEDVTDVLGGLGGGAIAGLLVGVVAGVFDGLLVLGLALLMPRRHCPDCGFAFPKIGRKYG